MRGTGKIKRTNQLGAVLAESTLSLLAITIVVLATIQMILVVYKSITLNYVVTSVTRELTLPSSKTGNGVVDVAAAKQLISTKASQFNLELPNNKISICSITYSGNEFPSGNCSATTLGNPSDIIKITASLNYVANLLQIVMGDAATFNFTAESYGQNQGLYQDTTG